MDVNVFNNWFHSLSTDLSHLPITKNLKCDPVRNHKTCCERVDFKERIFQISEWSEHNKLNDFPILYLFSGLDLINAIPIFPKSSHYILAADHPTTANKNILECLKSSSCKIKLAKLARDWYEHVACLGFRSSMSSRC